MSDPSPSPKAPARATPLLWSILWLVAYFGARGALEGSTLDTWLRVTIALAPIPIAAMTLVTIVRAATQLDELQRRIQLESIALAFAVGAAVITGWGYFETAGAPRADWGLFIWPFFIGTWLASLYAIRRRYR
jgi:xanthine/uracil permease